MTAARTARARSPRRWGRRVLLTALALVVIKCGGAPRQSSQTTASPTVAIGATAPVAPQAARPTVALTRSPSPTPSATVSPFISGMAFIDIKGNLEGRDLATCREGRGTSAWSLTCNGVTASVVLEVVALGDDPTKVAYVQATSTQTTTASDRIAAAVLGFIATLPYDGAQPQQARSWVESNISATAPATGKAGATTVIGAARISITKRNASEHVLEMSGLGRT